MYIVWGLFGVHVHVIITCISSANQIQSPDEEDFDQFLENVKARSLSAQKQGEHYNDVMFKYYPFINTQSGA